MKVCSDFNRMCLKDIQKAVKRVYPSVDMRRVLGTHKQPRGRWYVEGHVPGTHINWHGRAEDANHAKYQAWREHMQKLGKLGHLNSSQ